MPGSATKVAQRMGFWANLGKNPYFEQFLWPNRAFLGLATFRNFGSQVKISNFPFIKFSQKLGPQDLRNLVQTLREPTFLNKVLWGGGGFRGWLIGVEKNNVAKKQSFLKNNVATKQCCNKTILFIKQCGKKTILFKKNNVDFF